MESNRFNRFDCVGFGICVSDDLCLLPEYLVLDQKTELIAFSTQDGGPVPTALMILLKKYLPAGFEIYIAQYVVLNRIRTCIFSDIFKPAGGFLD